MKPIINTNNNTVTTIKIFNNRYNYFVADVDWKETFLITLDWENDILHPHIFFSDEHLEHILKLKYDISLI